MEKSFPLDKLIDLEELQSIQDSFARAAGISSVIFSAEGKPLTRLTNPTGFCSLIQSTGKGKERCFRSFMEMGKIAIGAQEPKICYCFAHGGHFVAPIMIDGEHKGTMFAGQFIPKKFSSEQLHDLEEIAHEIDLDPGLLVKEAGKMPVVGENMVRNYSILLFKIVEVIARRGAQAAELIRAKDALERRVRERTAELAETNKGLKHEITERKKAEKILKDSKIKLQLLYDSSSDAIMLLDEKGFFDCNDATLRLFGCASLEEFCSKHPSDFSPPTQPDGTDSMSYARNNIAVALKEGSKRFEHLHRRSDGTDFPAEVLLDALMMGGKKVLQARVYDITERKAAQEAIKESEKRYKTLFEFGMDGILIANIETKRFKYANPALCKMLGYSAEELKGMSISDIHPKDNFEHVISDFEAQARGEKTLVQDIPCLRKDGTIIYADINTTSAIVDGKKCNIGLFRDNSERKAAEEESKKKADELEKFNKLAVGRELKMIELKKEINALLEKLGKEPGYKIVGEPQGEVF